MIYKQNEIVKTLPCVHYFYNQCVNQWFNSNHDTCPECGHPIHNMNRFN